MSDIACNISERQGTGLLQIEPSDKRHLKMSRSRNPSHFSPVVQFRTRLIGGGLAKAVEDTLNRKRSPRGATSYNGDGAVNSSVVRCTLNGPSVNTDTAISVCAESM